MGHIHADLNWQSGRRINRLQRMTDPKNVIVRVTYCSAAHQTNHEEKSERAAVVADILPIIEVSDDVIAHCARLIRPGIRVEALPRLRHRKFNEAYRKSYPTIHPTDRKPFDCVRRAGSRSVSCSARAKRLPCRHSCNTS